MSTESTNPILSTSPILEVKNLSLSYGKKKYSGICIFKSRRRASRFSWEAPAAGSLLS